MLNFITKDTRKLVHEAERFVLRISRGKLTYNRLRKVQCRNTRLNPYPVLCKKQLQEMKNCAKKKQHYHHVDKAFEASMMPMQNVYDCSNITPNYC